jgi:hypothetical protein
LEKENEKQAKIDQILDEIFSYEKKTNVFTINASYPYWIKLDRIPHFQALAHWVDHLANKSWMTLELIQEFQLRICKIKGWQIRGNKCEMPYPKGRKEPW